MKPTSEHIDQAVWEIWKFVRVNKNSLNSGECCKRIRAVIDMAVASIAADHKSMSEELSKAKERNKELRQKLAIKDVQAA